MLRCRRRAGESPLTETVVNNVHTARDKQRAAGASILAALLLTVLKLLAGLATASIGLLAEAAHSALDLCAAVLTWVAVRASGRPPDADHQYGHGKIENIAALAETGLLVLTSGWIVHEAVQRLAGGGPEVRPTVWAFAVMALSIAVDWGRSRNLRRVARETRSPALEADALHFSTDMVSSAVVILGLLGVLLAGQLGWTWLSSADPVAAILVAVIVLVLSLRMGKRAFDVLMDRAPRGLRSQVEQALGGIEGVHGQPRVRTREAGDRLFVDVELSLRRGLPLQEGERIAEEARSRVQALAEASTSVLVQLRTAPEEDVALRDRIAMAVAAEGQLAHNITLREDDRGTQADLHLELPGSLTLAAGHAVTDRVEARILREVPELRRVDVHLEIRGEGAEQVEPPAPGERRELERRIHEGAIGLVGEGALHDLMLTRSAGGVYLSCHCFLPADTSMSETHEITDRLELALRRAIPELSRVAVHAEPEGHHS